MATQQEKSLQNAAKAATGPDKSGRGLSSTARIMMALSQTSELTQQLTGQIDLETKRTIDAAIAAEAHAAQSKKNINDHPDKLLKDWLFSAQEIIGQLEGERKTQKTGEEYRVKHQNLTEVSNQLSSQRNALIEEIETVKNKLQKIIPELITKLKLGNVSKDELKGYVKNIRDMDQVAIKVSNDFSTILSQEEKQIVGYQKLYKDSENALLGASIAPKGHEPSPKPQD